MNTEELVRQYRLTWIGRQVWPRAAREPEIQGPGEKPPPSPGSLLYRPRASTAPDASPWDKVGHGGRAHLVLQTVRDLQATGQRHRAADVAEHLGAPRTSIESHIKRLAAAGLIQRSRQRRA